MPLTASEFDKVINKFGFTVKSGHHIQALLYIDGRVVVRTKRSHQSSGDLRAHNQIRNQLKLTESQLREAIACPLDREGYLEILRGKGII